ncbi:MAG: rhodanese-like domain-containing protein [Acidiferrobacterales bacterium]
MQRFSFVFALALASLFVATSSQAISGPFPHREKFKDVPVIESQDLMNKLSSVNVVDVRSKYEYKTLHIKGAVNIPLSEPDFAAQVGKLIQSNSKPVVFYCNGGTCKKSYKAVKAATKGGVRGTTAYDAGIYAWAQAYPEYSVLLGKNPMNANEFIDNKTYKARIVDARRFEKMMGPNAIVLDIRDRIQRDLQLFPFNEHRAELDDVAAIRNYVQMAKRSRKTLLVYDKVGKQVRWFQYYLEKEGVRNYYFMKGGSEGYYEAKLGKFQVHVPEH